MTEMHIVDNVGLEYYVSQMEGQLMNDYVAAGGKPWELRGDIRGRTSRHSFDFKRTEEKLIEDFIARNPKKRKNPTTAEERDDFIRKSAVERAAKIALAQDGRILNVTRTNPTTVTETAPAVRKTSLKKKGRKFLSDLLAYLSDKVGGRQAVLPIYGEEEPCQTHVDKPAVYLKAQFYRTDFFYMVPLIFKVPQPEKPQPESEPKKDGAKGEQANADGAPKPESLEAKAEPEKPEPVFKEETRSVHYEVLIGEMIAGSSTIDGMEYRFADRLHGSIMRQVVSELKQGHPESGINLVEPELGKMRKDRMASLGAEDFDMLSDMIMKKILWPEYMHKVGVQRILMGKGMPAAGDFEAMYRVALRRAYALLPDKIMVFKKRYGTKINADLAGEWTEQFRVMFSPIHLLKERFTEVRNVSPDFIKEKGSEIMRKTGEVCPSMKDPAEIFRLYNDALVSISTRALEGWVAGYDGSDGHNRLAAEKALTAKLQLLHDTIENSGAPIENIVDRAFASWRDMTAAEFDRILGPESNPLRTTLQLGVGDVKARYFRQTRTSAWILHQVRALYREIRVKPEDERKSGIGTEDTNSPSQADTDIIQRGLHLGKERFGDYVTDSAFEYMMAEVRSGLVSNYLSLGKRGGTIIEGRDIFYKNIIAAIKANDQEKIAKIIETGRSRLSWDFSYLGQAVCGYFAQKKIDARTAVSTIGRIRKEELAEKIISDTFRELADQLGNKNATDAELEGTLVLAYEKISCLMPGFTPSISKKYHVHELGSGKIRVGGKGKYTLASDYNKRFRHAAAFAETAGKGSLPELMDSAYKEIWGRAWESLGHDKMPTPEEFHEHVYLAAEKFAKEARPDLKEAKGEAMDLKAKHAFWREHIAEYRESIIERKKELEELYAIAPEKVIKARFGSARGRNIRNAFMGWTGAYATRKIWAA